MTTEWSRRAFVIIIAYLAASSAAGISILLVEELRGYVPLPLTLQSVQIMLSSGIKFGIFFVATIAAIPAAIFIALAERRRWSSLVLHLAFGGALAASLIWFLLIKLDLHIIGLFVLHGAVAGLVYWLIAGRNAGLQKTETP